MANSLNTITVNGTTYDADTYQASQASSSNASSNTLGKDAFLELLVTQLKYQDPLNPLDNSEYVAQLAQFSSLEQMTNVAESLEKTNTLVSNIDSSILVGQLSNMIDKQVEWTTETVETDAQGKAVTDKNGNAVTTKQTREGSIKGVSISDGQPSLVAESNGKSYKVAISDITRVGEGA